MKKEKVQNSWLGYKSLHAGRQQRSWQEKGMPGSDGSVRAQHLPKPPPSRGDRAMPWPGELGKAALHSQNNPPYTSSATLEIVLLKKTPKPLSSFPSQLTWASLWQQFLPEVFRLCSCGQSARDLRQTGLLHPKKLQSILLETAQMYIRGTWHNTPDRQGYLWTETTPLSFNNRKKYSDVDKSTHPVKLFSPLGAFFFPSLLLFSKLIHITCAFWFHYVRCY